MAKTIKFNLILDGKPVRTIGELQENFCIDDILEFYQKGLLQKWLKVRGYEDYLKKVEAISEKKSVIIEIIKIFDIEKSEKEIKEAVYSLEYWDERKRKLEEWHNKDLKIKKIISDYHNGYLELKAKILEYKCDMPFMKITAKEIFDKYFEIFQIDFKYFFNEFKESSPLIIYATLMNNNIRYLFLNEPDIQDELTESYTLNKLSQVKELIYSKFDIYSKKDIPEYDENNSIEKVQKLVRLHIFTGETEGYWKDLEITGTKVIVLSIPDGTFVRNANKPLEEFSSTDVNGNFLILDGLCYKSNNGRARIIYMEV